MQVCDFSRSFITFVTPGHTNNARIQVEARCDLTTGDHTEQFWLVASCKAEDTYAQRNLFKSPNYDFCVIYSSEGYRMHRVGMPYDEQVMDVGLISDRFEAVHFGIKSAEADLCEEPAAVVEATLVGRLLVGRTAISSQDGTATALLEYPIKTMNVHTNPADFQVDTGPLLLPAFASGRPALEAFSLSFVAWRTPDWAEFILQQAVPATPTGPTVAHYAGIKVLSGENQVFAYD